MPGYPLPSPFPFLRCELSLLSSPLPRRANDDFYIGNKEAKHALPIGLMGNYQEALTKREYLRDLNDDDDLKKRPIFGNPYGNDKRPKFSTNLIDEDEDKYKTDKSVSKQQQRPKQSSLISTYFSGLPCSLYLPVAKTNSIIIHMQIQWIPTRSQIHK